MAKLHYTITGNSILIKAIAILTAAYVGARSVVANLGTVVGFVLLALINIW